MARQNIADLEAAGDKKHEQAAELRSQLTALLAAESKSLESFVSTTSSATSSDNSLAQEAAQKLITIAKEDPDFTVATDGGTVTEAALTDLLRITADRLGDNYQAYQSRHDTGQTPPPEELVAAAHDLETALKQIRKGEYEVAVMRLQSLLEQLDDVNDDLADNTQNTATSSTTSSTTASSATSSAATTTQTAASTTESNSKATSSTQQPASSTDDTQAVAPSIPSKQNLHNETISDILKRVRSYLDEIGQKAGEKNKKQAATSTPMDDKTKKQASTTASSTASSTPEQSNSGTSSDNGQAGSPDPQQGDESRP